MPENNNWHELSDHYIRMQRKYRPQIGDRVKILAKASNHDGGWSSTWNPEMDTAIGHTGTIVDIQMGAIGVKVPDARCSLSRRYFYYPYFVLEIQR